MSKHSHLNGSDMHKLAMTDATSEDIANLLDGYTLGASRAALARVLESNPTLLPEDTTKSRIRKLPAAELEQLWGHVIAAWRYLDSVASDDEPTDDELERAAESERVESEMAEDAASDDESEDSDATDEDEEDEDNPTTMAATLARHRVRYVPTVAYSGKKSLNNGDLVASALAGLSPSKTMALADSLLELGEGFCESKYGHLNPGQRRMNAGNRIRAAFKKGNERVIAWANENG